MTRETNAHRHHRRRHAYLFCTVESTFIRVNSRFTQKQPIKQPTTQWGLTVRRKISEIRNFEFKSFLPLPTPPINMFDRFKYRLILAGFPGTGTVKRYDANE